jgi:L-cysteine desulfidase
MVKAEKIEDNLILKTRMMTAAAADARMGGVNLPVMTSAGSGNHGITITIPLAVVAEHYEFSREKLAKALALSNLITFYIKTFTGALSPVCGCAIAAGVGVSSGITWMLGGKDKDIVKAINNMLGSLTGMICDGAKSTCALKVATSAAEAVTSAHLALNNDIEFNYSGIIASEVEATIKNLGVICNQGLKDMDQKIIEVI